ncbi:MAG: hypothetical protein IT310_07500 [Anaerolineales bacterium]|nr:hypothetical protein [Anaerolineales bacterium]
MSLNFTETTLPTLALWGIGLGAILIGFLIGYIDSNLRSAKLINAANEKADVVRAESEKKIAEAEALKAQISEKLDDPGLLRLRNKNGVPTLELDGALITAKDIAPGQKKRLLELLAAIRPWIESGQPAPVSTPKVATPAPQPAPKPAAPQPAVSSPSPISPATQPAFSKLTEKEFKALSIINQIDYVFQSRIVGSAHEGLGIRIMEGAGGAVEVKIGSAKYPSIDDVPDAEIKKAIRAAITEWEDKHIPGQ